MSEHERGAYTPPTDAPLNFDPRQPVRGSRPIPITLIVSVLVLIGLGGAIAYFYQSGVRHAGEPPQTVGAPVVGMKAPPPAEAQPQDPAAGLQIYKTEGGKAASSAAPQFTPPPEQPQARALPPAPAPAAKTAGVAAVQIGAFSSQALADKGWSDAAAVSPGLAAGKGKSVEKVDKDGKTLFRTQVTGFSSRAAATAFCDKLKAAGKACFVK
jgi:hypothetical protein